MASGLRYPLALAGSLARDFPHGGKEMEENPDLLEHCGERRREIQNTRQQLADYQAMRIELG